MDPLTILGLDRDPDKPFIRTPDDLFTRGRLLRRAAAVGERLRAAGISGGRAVVALANGERFASGLVGCWLAGVTPVLLDPRSHRELPTALEMTGARAVIGPVADEASLPPGVLRVPVDDREADPYPAAQVADDAPLVYLFTSGSTGKPTLVPKDFAALNVEIEFLNNLFDLPLRVGNLVPWCHIFGFIVSFLVPGSRGALCDLTAGISPGQLLARAAGGHLDLVAAVPLHYRAMVRYLESGEHPALAGRCRFASSGAPLDGELRERFTALSGCVITDLYGSTEAGGVAYRNDDGPWIVQPHVEARVDEHGFLTVRSPSVSMGPKGGFYPMGDLVRLEGRGFVLEGREDDVVKIGGRRIALGEVQNILERCPSVIGAAVLSEKVRGVERIVAFVETRTGDAEVESIKAFVRERLADHKVPAVIRPVGRIPRTPAGKVDRQALRALLSGEK